MNWSEFRRNLQGGCPGALEVVLALSLEVLQTHLDTALNTLD